MSKSLKRPLSRSYIQPWTLTLLPFPSTSCSHASLITLDLLMLSTCFLTFSSMKYCNPSSSDFEDNSYFNDKPCFVRGVNHLFMGLEAGRSSIVRLGSEPDLAAAKDALAPPQCVWPTTMTRIEVVLAASLGGNWQRPLAHHVRHEDAQRHILGRPVHRRHSEGPGCVPVIMKSRLITQVHNVLGNVPMDEQVAGLRLSNDRLRHARIRAPKPHNLHNHYEQQMVSKLFRFHLRLLSISNQI